MLKYLVSNLKFCNYVNEFIQPITILDVTYWISSEQDSITEHNNFEMFSTCSTWYSHLHLCYLIKSMY